MMGVEAIKNERLKAKSRGVNFRYVTEVTKDNIVYCKQLSEFAEVRHLNRVKGNFEVSKNGIKGGKGEYIGTATLQEAEPIAQLTYSNVEEIVEQEQFVFDTLWNKAIPFQVIAKEIEQGIKPESIEIIVDPKQALETEYALLKSAKEEVQMIFSTVNTFLLQERQLGITQILSNLSNQGVRVRVLTPMNNDVKELVSNLKRQQQKAIHQNNQANKNKNNDNTDTGSNIDIQDIVPSSSINAKIILVDKQDSLAMEIKDGVKDNLYDTVGLSTYSNSKSTIASYYAIFENICKQNQLYEQLKDAYQKVEATNAMQREFINVAAHELRTPIQAVLGYAELLLEEETDDRKKQALMAITQNSGRLRKLASDILDIAKIESNTFRLNMIPLNLNTLLSSIIEDFIERHKQHRTLEDTTRALSNIDLSSNDDDRSKVGNKTMNTNLFFESTTRGEEDNNIIVEADEGRLTQVIDNILDNAFKFTDSDGSVTVTLEKQEAHPQQPQQDQIKQQHVNIIVKDTGTGIDPQILPRLFTKFATKSNKGTGLGLYLSRNIVESHGGKIWAENNKDGKGATFTINLPLSTKKQ
jgi:two-component system sensor histidine kinase VicK